jgi:G3E family GTPase
MTAERRRVLFAVIGGFLGAGKTTLLNSLLHENAARAAPRRIAVLVNDFGEVNIDAALVQGRAGETIALSNGCVCCQIGDDLMLALVRVLEAPQPFDAIVVEASGISDPWRIAQIARADPTLEPEAIVVLVDASAVVAQAADPLLADSLARQVRRADVIVLNKVDLADPALRARARAWIAETAGDVLVFETVDAALPVPMFGTDWRVLGDGEARAADQVDAETAFAARPMGRDGAAPAERFESRTFRPKATLRVASLRALLAAMPAGVLRLKGIVRTDEHGWSEIQFAGRHGLLRPALAAPADGVGAIVAIGRRGSLPGGALAATLEAAACGTTRESAD